MRGPEGTLASLLSTRPGGQRPADVMAAALGRHARQLSDHEGRIQALEAAQDGGATADDTDAGEA
jgi:hypothetical protein